MSSSENKLKLIAPEPSKLIQRTPELRHYLKAMCKHNASDLHLKSDAAPIYRVNGKLVAAKSEALSAETVKNLLFAVLTHDQIKTLQTQLHIDVSINLPDYGRFRANIYHQKGTLAAAIRLVPKTIPVYDRLGIPDVVKEMALHKKGLILVTGATGSGKSTTMAALINYLNRTKTFNIITIEDPIEFVHEDIKSSVSQRETRIDTLSTKDALHAALRQDPDVIAIGEMRDYETISTALTAAETGHLVISTLHTTDAKSTIDRIIDVFPAEGKDQVRAQLSACLSVVLSQRLVERKDGNGRVVACEVLLNSPTVQNLIRENKLEKINEAMMTSNTYYKMLTFNQSLEALVHAGVITVEEALVNSNSPDDLQLRLSGFKREEGY